MAATFRGIRAIFYAEFDNIVGPKVLHQTPESYISPEDFDDISEYMITKPDLCGKIMTVIHPTLTAPCEEEEDGGEAPATLPATGPSPVTAVAAALAAASSSALPSAPSTTTPASALGTADGSSSTPPPASPPPRRRQHHPGKIITFPVGLRHEKYGRNALLFSVGFVLNVDADSRPFEPVLRKLGMSLYSLEIESELLCRPDKKAHLASILPAILHGLNSRGECFVAVDSCATIALKLFAALPTPAAVRDSDVPVRLRDLDLLAGTGDESGWDLAMRVLLPHIDGRNYVRAISEAADVEISLVKRTIQHLCYYGCVALVDIFQYSNIYATTPRVQLLLRSHELRTACMRFIQADDTGSVMMMAAGMGRSLSAAGLNRSSAGALAAAAAAAAAGGGAGGGPPLPTPLALADPSSGGAGGSPASPGGGAAESALWHTHPTLRFDRVFRLYSAFGAGSRTCDVCAQGDTASLGIDDRRFITFGVLHGLLRRVHKYPVPVAAAATGAPAASGAAPDSAAPAPAGSTPPASAGPPAPTMAAHDVDDDHDDAAAAASASVAASTGIAPAALLRLLDGEHSLEDICCKLACAQQAVEEAIDRMGGFVYVLK